jgi:hypothetical protein
LAGPAKITDSNQGKGDQPMPFLKMFQSGNDCKPLPTMDAEQKSRYGYFKKMLGHKRKQEVSSASGFWKDHFLQLLPIQWRRLPVTWTLPGFFSPQQRSR